MQKIKMICDVYFNEGHDGGLVKGYVGWGSNPMCWLYLAKGTKGILEDGMCWFSHDNIETSLDEEWYELID